MATQNFDFVISLANIQTDIIEALKEGIEDAVVNGGNLNILGNCEFPHIETLQDTINEKLDEMCNDLEDPDSMAVSSLAVAVVGQDLCMNLVVSYTENEPEETTTDEPDYTELFEVLNELGLTVSKKNRILAILNEG